MQCQRAKIQRHTVSPLSPFPLPGARLDVIFVDIVCPLPPSRRFAYLLTYVDQFTHLSEVIPSTSITTNAVAQAFLSRWISLFGVPSAIVTDFGQQIESHRWNNLMSIIGFKRAWTTAYHPQTNGMVERFH